MEEDNNSLGWIAAHIGGEISNQLKKISDDIDKNDINVEKGGIEEEHHVTILYGVTDGQEEIINEILSKEKSFNVVVSRLNYFSNDGYDVLYAEVDSDGIKVLNSKLTSKLKYKNDYPVYKPHMTVAYLLPGTARKYLNHFTFTTLSSNVSDVVYHNSDKTVQLKYHLKNGDTSDIKKVKFKDIGTSNKWIESIPEKFKDKIVPFFFEKDGYCGVAIVSDTVENMLDNKKLFDKHVKETKLRPRFCYLNRVDSLHVVRDKSKAAISIGPEGETEDQSGMNITQQDVDNAPPDPDMILGDEMEEFKNLL